MLNHFWRLLCAASFHFLPLTRCFALRRWLLLKGGASVGEGARLVGGTRIVGRGELRIGTDTWLGPYGLIFTHPDAPIFIGDRCDIAPEVCFITGSHELGEIDRRAGAGLALPIKVGNGCWIGARATILGGVSIGSGAVVAAGAVVTTDVEPNSIVGGVPARLIRALNGPSAGK